MRAVQLCLAFTLCLMLSACTAASTSSNEADLSGQIASLERTQAQMRIQYNTMGHTLTRLEQRIAELKARAGQQRAAAANEAPAPSPAPRAAVTRTRVDDNKPMQLVSTPAPRRAQPAAPQARPQSTPAVGTLTEQDMEVQAAPSAAVRPSAGRNANRNVGGQSYLVHLASYLDTGPVRPGWRELSRKYAAPLDGLAPYVTPYTDNQDRRWLRLSAGPFSTSSSAQERCNALKAQGGWCEIMRVSNASLRELH